MSENLIVGSIGALCVVLLFALLWSGGATPGVFALIGLGAAMMVAVCVIAEG